MKPLEPNPRKRVADRGRLSSPIHPIKTPPQAPQDVYAPKEEGNGFALPAETIEIIAEAVGSLLSGLDDFPATDSFESGGGDFGGAGSGSDW